MHQNSLKQFYTLTVKAIYKKLSLTKGTNNETYNQQRQQEIFQQGVGIE